MARPHKEIDEKQMRALMRLMPSLADTANFFECSERTIERYVREHFELSFSEFREQNMIHTRLNIKRKAIDKAEKGDNVMLIFCLKNLCGWRDKQPGEEDKILVPQKSKEEVEARIKELLEKDKEPTNDASE